MNSLSESKNPLPIAMFVESLRYVMPPQTVIHIGAGTGQGVMHHWQNWDVPRALIVDADEARLAWASNLSAIHSEWQIVTAVIAEQDIETDYYHASNPNEDGLIPPAQLSPLWSNLYEKALAHVSAQSLDSLVDAIEFPLPKSSVTWTIIDCLSAFAIFKGAKKALEVSSVLWLRVLLQPLSSQNEVATIKEITPFLQSLGYRCVNVIESNHPAIGEALFVRDWQTVLEQNVTAIAEVELNQIRYETIIAELQSGNASTEANKLALEQLLADQDVQRTTLQQEKSVLETETQTLQAELLALGNEREVQRQHFESEITSLKNEIERLNHDYLVVNADKTALENLLAQQSDQRRSLQNEMLSLAQMRDEQTYLANKRQVQIDSLSQTNTQLQNEKSAVEVQVQALQNEISVLTTAQDEQAQLANERQKQIDSLSQTNTQLQQEKSAVEVQVQTLQNEVLELTETRDEQLQLVNERQKQIESLSQANTQLQQEKSVIETQVQSLKKARDEQNQIIVQNKIVIEELRNTLQQNENRVTQLETHLTESDARQKMLNEEIIKAEAQIELIKDVLLREQNL